LRIASSYRGRKSLDFLAESFLRLLSRRARVNYAYPAFEFAVRHKYKPLLNNMTDCDLPAFGRGMIGIRKRKRELKYRCGISERYPMFLEVGGRFRAFHSYIKA